MSKHKGEHPRMGATDVCPLIPITGISMEETVAYAKALGARVGKELKIPVYLYEAAQANQQRSNLSVIRSGEYEGFFKKIKLAEWTPDYGPPEHSIKSGATVIGARDFLVAYNINLNTTSVRRANAIAFDVRETGRVKRAGDTLTGKIITDEKNNPIYIPGTLKSVKAIGWYIKEYGIAQISMNLTNINVTPVHIAFEEVNKKANERGIRVTGSELVGLIPLKAMLDAGNYFLEKQNRSTGVSEKEKIKIAVKSMGLDELSPFKPEERIIEYLLTDASSSLLVSMSLSDFADETASESPAPGGGSISAYVGSLGISLATMVANLSAHKPGWDNRCKEFSEWAEKGQYYKNELLKLVDEDTNAFNKIMKCYSLPKTTVEEKEIRTAAIQKTTKYAAEVPLKVMHLCYQAMEVIKVIAKIGNPTSISDVGVGVLCARAAIRGAFLNVKINSTLLTDKLFSEKLINEANVIDEKACLLEAEIIKMIELKI
jgi:glutamate formiminotransferase/formiminotetrahydrofolate cyclodeaminase